MAKVLYYQYTLADMNPKSLYFAIMVVKNEGDWTKIQKEIQNWSLNTRGIGFTRKKPKDWDKRVLICYKTWQESKKTR